MSRPSSNNPTTPSIHGIRQTGTTPPPHRQPYLTASTRQQWNLLFHTLFCSLHSHQALHPPSQTQQPSLKILSLSTTHFHTIRPLLPKERIFLDTLFKQPTSDKRVSAPRLPIVTVLSFHTLQPGRWGDEVINGYLILLAHCSETLPCTLQEPSPSQA
jgi:hypothetical protein